MKTRNRLGIVLGAAVMSSLLGLSGAALAQPSGGDQVVVGQVQFVPNIHPLIQVNNTKRAVIGYTQRPISAYDYRGVLVCIMCETLPTLENKLARMVGKGMQVTIKLKRGLAWGDGKPVTSRDIAFTWRMGIDPRIGFSNYNPWSRATQVDVVDQRTVVLHLPTAMPGFNAWDQVLPEHIEGPIFEKHRTVEDYLKQTTYNRAPTTPGIWNGPFIFTSYQPGTSIVMNQNPHWPAPKPGLARVILTYRSNSAALLQNFLSGEIDALPVSPAGVSFSQMLDVRKRFPDRYTYHVRDGDNLERIALQLSNPILADIRVRKALMHSIDRKAITDSLFDGLQKPANSLLPDTSPLYEKAVAQYSFDQARARTLLAEAGWKPGADGICQNAKGERLSLEFITTAGNQTRQQITQVVQSQLKQVCVDIVARFVALNEFNSQMLRQRAFKGMIMGSIDFPPSASPRIVLGSNMIPSTGNSYVGNNFSGFSNPKMDAAIDQAEQTLNETAVKAAWSTVQKIAMDELPFLPLYFYARAYMTVKDLYDFEGATSDPLSNWSETWKRRPAR